jgi:hypothetical protein
MICYENGSEYLGSINEEELIVLSVIMGFSPFHIVSCLAL